MRHYRWEEVACEQMNPAFARRVIHGDRLTLAYLQLKKGGRVPMHSHEQEQICTVFQGRLRFEIGGREQIVGAGEVVQIPSGVPHQVEVLDDCVCLDIFTPVREDWLRGDDAYLRR
jgi:quercetin dioxygenase-like cupin family protein